LPFTNISVNYYAVYSEIILDVDAHIISKIYTTNLKGENKRLTHYLLIFYVGRKMSS